MSVTEQSGIEAGDGGFNVKVAGNTNLVGGVIASTQPAVDAGKNSFQSSSLTTSNITNTSVGSASGYSVGAGYSDARAGSTAQTTGSLGLGSASSPIQTSQTTSGISDIAGNTAVRTGDTSSAGTLARPSGIKSLMGQVGDQVTITAQFSNQATYTWGQFADSQYAQAVKDGDADATACWAPDGSCRALGHAIVGGLAGGIGGATGAAASSLTGTDINNVLVALGLPQGVADGLTVAITAGIGAATGGRTGAAGATNEVLNNALLSKATIDALVQQGGWETIRACLASPNCVNLIGSETAAKLYVSLNVTDAIDSAIRGMPDITRPSANEKNYQGTGGAAGAQAFFDSMPIEPGSEAVAPNGTITATLVDGTTIGLYLARSTQGASVQINRPGGISIKVRF